MSVHVCVWEKWYKNVSVLSEVSQTPRHKHCEILLSGRCKQSSPQTQKAGPQTPHGKGGGEGEDTEAVPHMDRTSSGKMRKLWTGMWRQSHNDVNVLDANELHAEKSLTWLFLY